MCVTVCTTQTWIDAEHLFLWLLGLWSRCLLLCIGDCVVRTRVEQPAGQYLLFVDRDREPHGPLACRLDGCLILRHTLLLL